MRENQPPGTPRGPLEDARTPDGPRHPGESAEKRNQDARNDPASMPGAIEGNTARRSGDGPPDDPGNRDRPD